MFPSSITKLFGTRRNPREQSISSPAVVALPSIPSISREEAERLRTGLDKKISEAQRASDEAHAKVEVLRKELVRAVVQRDRARMADSIDPELEDCVKLLEARICGAESAHAETKAALDKFLAERREVSRSIASFVLAEARAARFAEVAQLRKAGEAAVLERIGAQQRIFEIEQSLFGIASAAERDRDGGLATAARRAANEVSLISQDIRI